MALSLKIEPILRRIEQASHIDAEMVTFVRQVKGKCPKCKPDPITGASANSFCPSCKGAGYIAAEEKKQLRASVERPDGLRNEFQYGGRLQSGSLVLTVHASVLEENGYSLSEDWVKVIDYVIADGEKYRIADGDGAVPQRLEGVTYEVIFHLTKAN